MKKIKILLLYLILLLNIWIGGCCTIQAILCPDLTQTELFLRIPNSFILDFKYVNENK